MVDAPADMARALPLVLVIGLLLAFRILGAQFPEHLPNFQPLAAVFFCGALLASSWKGFAIPAGVWLVSYPLGIGHSGSLSLFLITLGSLGLIFLMGRHLSTKGVMAMLLGSLVAAATFHLITCGFSWLASPRYPNHLLGLWQSAWAGAPGDLLPSWVFLRNLAAANFLFTAVFMAARTRMPAQAAFSSKQDLAESP